MSAPRFRRVSPPLVTLLLAAALVPLMASPAAAAQFVSFDNSNFGANQAVVVNLGDGDYHTDCPAGGLNDFVNAATDFYILPSGTALSEGQGLRDVQGRPHTVVYSPTAGFIDEPFGFTAPFGKIGPGTYEIVWDECQTGKFYSAFDFVQDPAFTVTIPSGTIPPVDPAVAKIKTDAGIQASSWSKAAFQVNALYAVMAAYNAYSCVTDPVDCLIGADAIIGYLEDQVSTATGVDIEAGIKSLLANEVKQYASIAADPPDPNFTQLAPAVLVPSVTSPDRSRLNVATTNAANQADQDAALAGALLHAIERYQGAANANSGPNALIQAKAIRDDATALADQLTHTNAALTALKSALVADPNNFDAVIANVQATINSVKASGFTASEVAQLRALGLSDVGIDTLKTNFTSQDLSGYSKTGLLSALSDLIAANSSARDKYLGLAADMGPIIATLQSQFDNAAASGADLKGAPQANPGGPYSVAERAPVTLDGRGSTTPQGAITSYGWDLTGTGTFTDASGATPTVTFDRPFDGAIGLRVTNDAGLQSIVYTHLTTTSNNQPPTINTFRPQPLHQVVSPGAATAFSLSAADPENEPLTFAWTVDGTVVAHGASFTYTAPSSPGVHVVHGVVTDSHPTDGFDGREWSVDVGGLGPVISGSTWYNDGSNTQSGGAGTQVRAYAVGAFSNLPYLLVLATSGCGTQVAVLNPSKRFATRSGFLGTTVGTIPAGVQPGSYVVCFKGTIGDPTATGTLAFTLS